MNPKNLKELRKYKVYRYDFPCRETFKAVELKDVETLIKEFKGEFLEDLKNSCMDGFGKDIYVGSTSLVTLLDFSEEKLKSLLGDEK